MRCLLSPSLLLAAALLVACGGGGAGPSGGARANSPASSAPARAASGAASAPAGTAAPVGQATSAIVQAAAQEGTLELYTPTTLEKTGAALLVDAFNRRYGLHVDFNYTPSGSMTRDAARVVTEISAGQP